MENDMTKYGTYVCRAQNNSGNAKKVFNLYESK